MKEWVGNLVAERPKDVSSLLRICEKKIADGDFRGAARIAQEYKNRFVDKFDKTPREASLDIGVSYYIIGEALLHMLRSGGVEVSYESVKAFFVVYYAGVFVYLQEALRDPETGGWVEDSEDLKYRDRMHDMYDEVRELFGDRPFVDDADYDASKILTDPDAVVSLDL